MKSYELLKENRVRHSFKIWFILAAGSIGLMVLGHQVADRRGLLWGFVIALGINCFVYFYGQVRLLQLFRRMEIEGQDPWGLLDCVRILAEKAKLPVPRVYIVDLPTPISFSVGRSWNHSSVVLSEALLEEFPPEDVAAVIAYEMARLKRHDTMTLGMASAIAKVVMWPAEGLEKLRTRFSKLREPLRFLQLAVDTILSLIANAFISFAVSRADYFAADQLASQFVGSPHRMADVLWKLDSYAQTKPLHVHPSVAHLFVVNPLTTRGWSRYFHRQPPVERRIEKLVGHFPI